MTDVRDRPTRGDRFRYWLDDYMSRGSRSSFTALLLGFTVALVVIGVIRVIAVAVFGGATIERGSSGWRQLYITFLELTDPGSMTQDIDSSMWVKIFAIISGMVGLVLLSSLIALITTAIDGRLAQLRKGHSAVLLEDHTLILGWSDRIVDVIGELVLANESEKKASIVILADEPKEEMDDYLALHMTDTLTTKVVTRSGPTSSLVNLRVASVETAKSVIVLASCNVGASPRAKATSDLTVTKTTLAIASLLPADSDAPIVAEVFGERERDLTTSIDPGRVVCIDTDEVLAKIIVQTSRSSGLAIVYEEMLSFDGAELYFFHEDWQGLTFSEASMHFPDGVPIGWRHGGQCLINPSSDGPIPADAELLILASDDSTIEFLPGEVATHTLPQPGAGVVDQHVEHQLIIGYSDKLATIAREYADYVLDGSSMDIALRQPDPELIDRVEELNLSIPSMDIRVVADNSRNIDDFVDLQPFEYDNIIILSQTSGESSEEWIDSETLLILMQLSRVFANRPGSSSTKLIAEILDTRNRELVTRTGVSEFIISNSLISRMVAQVSEDPGINSVYDNLFDEAGSEVYVKALDLYVDGGAGRISFGDLMEAAQARNEIAIGVKLGRYEANAEANFGVQLIPAKDHVFDLEAGDCLVVVSEDET